MLVRDTNQNAIEFNFRFLNIIQCNTSKLDQESKHELSHVGPFQEPPTFQCNNLIFVIRFNWSKPWNCSSSVVLPINSMMFTCTVTMIYWWGQYYNLVSQAVCDIITTFNLLIHVAGVDMLDNLGFTTLFYAPERSSTSEFHDPYLCHTYNLCGC